jgi:hypothetical protein
MHGEMMLDGRRIMMGQGSEQLRMVSPHGAGTATQGVFIYLHDVDAHHERALAAGAEIVKPPEDLPCGRSYTARDLDGHPWFFTTPLIERRFRSSRFPSLNHKSETLCFRQSMFSEATDAKRLSSPCA